MTLIYGGVGSRQTPIFVQSMMTKAAYQMSQSGWHLRSGFAEGADKAFGLGAAQHSEQVGQDRFQMFLPWSSYNQAPSDPCFTTIVPTTQLEAIAREAHRRWGQLSHPVHLLLMRNVPIVLGVDLKTPAQCVLGWTPRANGEGGTGHTYRIARLFNIPVFDLASEIDQKKASEFIYDRTSEYFDIPW